MLGLYLEAFLQTYFGNFFIYSANPTLFFTNKALNFNYLLKFAEDIRPEKEIQNFNLNVNSDISPFKKTDFHVMNSSNFTSLEEPTISSIFILDYVEPNEKMFYLIINKFETVLNDDFSTSSVNSCLNDIFNNKRFSFSDKAKLLDKVLPFVNEKMKIKPVSIDTAEIIKNIIYNDNCNIRLEKFFGDLYKNKAFNYEECNEIIWEILKADKFDSIHIGIAVFLLDIFYFDFSTVIGWLDYSIKKIEENTVRDVRKLKEFLEIILCRITLTENSFTSENLRNFINLDLKLFYMNFNLKTTFFYNQKAIHKDLVDWMCLNFVDILFSACNSFDIEFTYAEFLEKYFFFFTRNYASNVFGKNPILRKNKFYSRFLQAKNADWNLSYSTSNMFKSNGKSEEIKNFLYMHRKSFCRFNYPSTKNVFDYFIENNYIDIAAQLVEKLLFVNAFINLDRKIVEKIFEIRNCRGTNNPIDESSLFFTINFKYLNYEHLKCYNIDQLIKIFTSFKFLSNNHDRSTQKFIINIILKKTSNPFYIRKYIKTIYESSLESVICIMIEIYNERNSKENNRFIRENNLFNLSCIIAGLPIPNLAKITYLNSFNMNPEKVSIFKNELQNILSHEEALDQLICLLHPKYNFENGLK